MAFSIGPVQGFVAQARRTRDLWCGSWLLSFLAETALSTAENNGGSSVIPFRSEQDRGHVTSKQDSIGGVPNRFELRFESESEAANAARQAVAAFDAAWNDIAREVWTKYVEHAIDQGVDTEAIWNRQIKHFWEVSWVVGVPDNQSPTIGHLAAARKNYRNVTVTAEPGVKCAIMPTMQELSGHKPGEQQREFWKTLSGKIGELDLAPTERLSAIALIKRLFPKISKQVIGVDLKTQRWPSTAFLAAEPWLNTLEGDALEKAKAFVGAAKGIGKSEGPSANAAGVQWASIDGSAWFSRSFQRNEWELESKLVGELDKQLRFVYEASDRRPIPYYALLLMDGDSMGKLLTRLGDPNKLSECLCKFTENVDDFVSAAKGRTVYAGGDDVMAMLPAERALDVASKLREEYQRAFAQTAAKDDATISGAIVYAHINYPLRQVLNHAHHLLDVIAKAATGRNALAIGIVQGSGLNSQWAAPWAVVRGELDNMKALAEVHHRFSASEESDEGKPNFNASFLYHLRKQFTRLFSQPLESPGSFGRIEIEADENSTQVLSALANAEYRRRLSKEEKASLAPDDSLTELRPLMALSQRAINDAEGNPRLDPESFGFDGWRIARFLRQVHDGKVTSDE